MSTDERRTDEHRAESDADVRRTRASARARHLAELLERRPDLFGVLPAADLMADSVRWSA